jgi:outer membrane lipoprotein-sorting protein
MKFILSGLLLFVTAFTGFSQEAIQDPEAGKILENVAAKFRTLNSIQTDYELLITDRKENKKNSSSGNLIMKQQKYKLNSQGNLVFFDGKTMWSYVSSNNEVTVTEPSGNSNDFLSNPSSFFASYKEQFKYRFVKETTRNGIQCDEIDLFPKNLDQPYSRVKVYINKLTGLPETIISVGKDGVDYTVTLKNTVLNREFPDSTFVFNPSQFKKVEVVDMRGL